MARFRVITVSRVKLALPMPSRSTHGGGILLLFPRKSHPYRRREEGIKWVLRSGRSNGASGTDSAIIPKLALSAFVRPLFQNLSLFNSFFCYWGCPLHLRRTGRHDFAAWPTAKRSGFGSAPRGPGQRYSPDSEKITEILRDLGFSLVKVGKEV